MSAGFPDNSPGYPFIQSWMDRVAVRVKCLAQEHRHHNDSYMGKNLSFFALYIRDSGKMEINHRLYLIENPHTSWYHRRQKNILEIKAYETNIRPVIPIHTDTVLSSMSVLIMMLITVL